MHTKKKSIIHFLSVRASYKSPFLDRFKKLITIADLKKIANKKEFAAVKLHWGEPGNTAYIRPIFVREIISYLQAIGTIPFLTDTNTLYRGRRSTAPDNICA
ncbi:DUF362 domain-containing protein, partial [Chlamydiota bacterium]